MFDERTMIVHESDVTYIPYRSKECLSNVINNWYYFFNILLLVLLPKCFMNRVLYASLHSFYLQLLEHCLQKMTIHYRVRRYAFGSRYFDLLST